MRESYFPSCGCAAELVLHPYCEEESGPTRLDQIQSAGTLQRVHRRLLAVNGSSHHRNDVSI